MSGAPGTVYLADGEESAAKYVCDGFSASISPDGSKLAYVTVTTNWQHEVRVRELRTGKVELIEPMPGDSSPPAFTSGGAALLWRQDWPASNITVITIYSLTSHLRERVVIEARRFGN